MTSIFDRLNAEMDDLGRKVHSVLETGRLQLERSSILARRHREAHRLGLLAWQKAGGATINEAEYEAALARMDDLAQQLAEVDRKIAEERGEEVSVGEKPAPPGEEGEAPSEGGAGA